ncbi:hypothetical protein BDY21DRAFT_133099 [Lineolata rhizophorae]|uniref:Secreted protein n=1 Tax=Lineolata rhizophorae TaxID=578093 RepID=A0A6A6PAJ5_9PEZI|nr:hypothetical protein BDY21DRAFT_133099 [Lineolata rhizophorae]
MVIFSILFWCFFMLAFCKHARIWHPAESPLFLKGLIPTYHYHKSHEHHFLLFLFKCYFVQRIKLIIVMAQCFFLTNLFGELCNERHTGHCGAGQFLVG